MLVLTGDNYNVHFTVAENKLTIENRGRMRIDEIPKDRGKTMTIKVPIKEKLSLFYF